RERTLLEIGTCRPCGVRHGFRPRRSPVGSAHPTGTAAAAWGAWALESTNASLGLRTRGLHEPQLIAIRVHHGHIAEPQVVIGGLGHDRPASTELRMPCVHIRDHEVNEPAYLAVPTVLGQVEPHSVAGNRHKHREVRLETVLPLDGEAERGDVVRFAPLI